MCLAILPLEIFTERLENSIGHWRIQKLRPPGPCSLYAVALLDSSRAHMRLRTH